jgi:small conductance mechanosensitive channel
MISAMLSLDLSDATTTADGFVGWLTTDGLRILITIIGAMALRWMLHRSIDRVVRGTVQRADERDRRTPGRAARVLSAATARRPSGTGSVRRPWARSSRARPRSPSPPWRSSP